MIPLRTHRRSVSPLRRGGRIVFYCALILAAAVLAGCGRPKEQSGKDAGKLLQQAQSLLQEGNYRKALLAARQALVLNREPEKDSALCETELLIGRIQRELGQYDSASMSFSEARGLIHGTADNGLERRVKIALGEFLVQMYQYEKAESLVTEAATTARFSTDPADMYLALSIARSADHELGRFGSELNVLRSLAEIDSQAFHGHTAATILMERIGALIALRQFDSAASEISRWEAASSAKHDTVGLARAQLQRATFRVSLSQPDSALRSYARALESLNRSPDPALRREVLLAMAHLSYREKRFEQASMYYTDVLSQIRPQTELCLQMLLKLQLIACEWKAARGRPEASAPTLQARCVGITEVCRQAGFRAGTAYGCFMEGRLAERRNESAAALKSYGEALSAVLEVPVAGVDELSRPFIDAFMQVEESGWFEAPLAVYCATDNVEEAFKLSERKNLMEAMRFFAAMDYLPPGDSLARAILESKRRLRVIRRLDEDIVERLQGPAGSAGETVKALRDLYAARLQEYAQAAEELAPLLGNYSRLVDPRPPSLKQVQPLLSADQALVEYVPLSDAVYLIVATKDDALIRKVPVNRRHLLSLVEEYGRLIGDPRLAAGGGPGFSRADAVGRLNELSSLLHGLLIDPLLPVLGTGKKVYVIYGREFGWLPLHTLRAVEGARRVSVIERYNISYLSSASEILFTLPQERASVRVIGMGHPGRTAWDVEYELDDIRAFYREAQLFFDTAATLARLASRTIDVLHLDAEAAVDNSYPDNSLIVLSDGITPLKPSDVPFGECMRQAPPQTVIFSDISATPGGLSHYGALAFRVNGCRTVIGTFWQGERKAKKYFGEVFYTNLITGHSASDSYHAAMVALAKKEEFSAAYRWGLYYQFGR